ncbi:pantetheinase-like [Cloeon dipterum]|uniref:pantetheinase-like n=1 Tax=Cloeon dipterum TaxID=197152 RepID=UPI0032201D36
MLSYTLPALMTIFAIVLYLFYVAPVPPTQEIQKVKLKSMTTNSFYAAVVEFSPKGALHNITHNAVEENLREYQKFTEQAKSLGADIIVFPEYGLTTIEPYNKHSLALELSQFVPDPDGLKISPCDLETNELDLRVVHKLSCLAKQNRIYLVANLIQKVIDKSEMLLFNTNVVFDRNGKVIARYRKFHLFGEIALNHTDIPDITTFITDFGVTFGVITCFDLMFRSPTVDLVRKFNVDAVVFPTAWFSELPFLTASQAQAAWAAGMKVSLLASGINNPKDGSTGTGVYQPGAFHTVMLSSSGSKLLVSKVGGSQEQSSVETSCGFKTLSENLTSYSIAALSLAGGQPRSETLCNSGFCCHVHFQLELGVEKSDDVRYSMLVLSDERLHAGQYKSKMQVCAIVACSGPEKHNCADDFSKSTFSKRVTFKYLTIEAKFSNDQVLPNTLSALNCGPLKPAYYYFTRDIGNHYSLKYIGNETGLHTFGLYSHGF